MAKARKGKTESEPQGRRSSQEEGKEDERKG